MGVQHHLYQGPRPPRFSTPTIAHCAMIGGNGKKPHPIFYGHARNVKRCHTRVELAGARKAANGTHDFSVEAATRSLALHQGELL